MKSRDEQIKELEEAFGAERAKQIQDQILDATNVMSEAITAQVKRALAGFENFEPGELPVAVAYWHGEMMDYFLHCAGKHAAESGVRTSEFVFEAAEAWNCCTTNRLVSMLGQRAAEQETESVHEAAKRHSEGN